MSKIPISYIIDDGGVVCTAHYHKPNEDHPFKPSIVFPKHFAQVCQKHGVRGKYSIVPMPCCIGRLDKGLVGFTDDELKRRLEVLRNEIAPMFSITPEILTHFRAYDLRNGNFLHVLEDVYFRNLDAETMTKYISLALEILVNAGFKPSGVTSPWYCGINNEENYSKAIGQAFVRTLGKKECFYFLHSNDGMEEPKVMQDSEETGRVVSIPALTDDIFWVTQNPTPRREARALMEMGIDQMLSEDGKSGAIVELLEKGKPITLITHWQSLYSDGSMMGLEGFEKLVARINSLLSDKVEWQTFAQIAGIQE